MFGSRRYPNSPFSVLYSLFSVLSSLTHEVRAHVAVVFVAFETQHLAGKYYFLKLHTCKAHGICENCNMKNLKNRQRQTANGMKMAQVANWLRDINNSHICGNIISVSDSQAHKCRYEYVAYSISTKWRQRGRTWKFQIPSQMKMQLAKKKNRCWVLLEGKGREWDTIQMWYMSMQAARESGPTIVRNYGMPKGNKNSCHIVATFIMRMRERVGRSRSQLQCNCNHVVLSILV